MILYIDVDLHIAVQAGTRSPTNPIGFKNQDTPSLNIYFVSQGVNQDLGAGAAIKFGLNLPPPAAVSLLVLDTVFNRSTDINGNIFYQGFPIFNTTQLSVALGTLGSLSCVAEIRYQLPSGEIVHTLDIPFTIYRTILGEISVDATTANFTVPAIGSNVNVLIGNTNWLASLVGQNVSIAGAGIYKVVSITNPTTFVAQNTGTTGNAVATTVISSGAIVGTTPPSVPTTYPDISTLELKVNKGAASGYASLDSGGKLLTTVLPVVPLADIPTGVELTANKDVPNGYAALDASELLLADNIPVDGTTVIIAGGKIVAIGQALGVLGVTADPFTVPAVGSNVTITVPTGPYVIGAYYQIATAGTYQYVSTTDSQHGIFTNVGGLLNAVPTTAILYNQNVSWCGAPGPTGPVPFSVASIAAWNSGTTYSGTAPASIVTYAGGTWVAVAPVLAEAPGAVGGHWVQIAAAGATGAAGTNGTSFTWRGAYAGGTTYAVNDVVSYLGSSYICILVSTGNLPTNATYWSLVAQTGASTGDMLKATYDTAARGWVDRAVLADTVTLAPYQTKTTSSFTVPALGGAVTIAITSASWPVLGQTVLITDGTLFMFAEVTTVTSGVSIAVTNRGFKGNNVSGTMASGALVALDAPGICTATQPGFVPAPPNDATKVLLGTGVFGAVPTIAQALDTLGATTDITTLNASTSAHGLLRKLDNTAAHYLDGTGAWSTPPAGGSFDPTTGVDDTEDFWGAAPWKWGWKTYATGVGVTPVNVACVSGDKTNGVVQLAASTGNASSGAVALALGNLTGRDFFTGQQPITITWRMRLATTLPTTSKYSKWFVGLFNNISDVAGARTGINNGLFFMFDPSLSSDIKWYAAAMQANSFAGSMATGVTADLSWHTFILTVGSSHVYSYTIDGVALTAPPTSNIDTTALALGVQGVNFDTGSGEIDLQIDFIRVQQTLAR
jgi:hypothetical protein